MREVINEEVSVVMYYSAKKKMAMPHIMSWRGEEYDVGEVGYHHKTNSGQSLNHIFEFVDKTGSYWFRLKLNTDNLHWMLETVSDGIAN